MQIELIEKSPFNLPFRNVIDERKEKILKTNPISYAQFPKTNNKDSSLKFAIKISSIGDFIPLRLWRYTGVQDILVGTIDLPLILFNDKDKESNVRQRVEW